MKLSGVQLARPMSPPGCRRARAPRAACSWSGVNITPKVESTTSNEPSAKGSFSASASLERHDVPLGLRAPAPRFEQRGDVVGGRHVAPAPRRGERRVAVAGGDVEHARARAQVERLAQALADDLQRRADDGVVAGGPGGLLARLDRGEIDGGVHGVPFSAAGRRRSAPRSTMYSLRGDAAGDRLDELLDGVQRLALPEAHGLGAVRAREDGVELERRRHVERSWRRPRTSRDSRSCEWRRCTWRFLSWVGTRSDDGEAVRDPMNTAARARRPMRPRSRVAGRNDARAARKPGPVSRASAARLVGEAGLARLHDGLRAVLDADLGEDGRDVVAHGLLGEVEVRGDLRVVEPARDVLEDLRARGASGRGTPRRDRPRGAADERLDLLDDAIERRLARHRHVAARLERHQARARDRRGDEAAPRRTARTCRRACAGRASGTSRAAGTARRRCR